MCRSEAGWVDLISGGHKWEIDIVRGIMFPCIQPEFAFPLSWAPSKSRVAWDSRRDSREESPLSRSEKKSDMWPLFLELLLCTAVLLFAPSPQIGLGVWGVYWWTKVFWRWATSATSASPPGASDPSPDPPNSPASGESPAPTLSASVPAQETISQSKRRNRAQKKKQQRSKFWLLFMIFGKWPINLFTFICLSPNENAQCYCCSVIKM